MSFSRNNPLNLLSPSQGYIDDVDFEQFTVDSLESSFHLETSPNFNRIASPFKNDNENLSTAKEDIFSSNIFKDDENDIEEPSSPPSKQPLESCSNHFKESSNREDDSDSYNDVSFESKRFNSLASHARKLSAAMNVKENNSFKSGVVSIKEQEKRSDELSKENFSLKLKVYHLEERLAKVSPEYKDEVFKENLAYKAQVRESINEVKRYRAQLLEARNFIEELKKRGMESSNCLLPHGMTPEEKEEFELQIEKSNKYRKQFKNLKAEFIRQENDIEELKYQLNQLSESKKHEIKKNQESYSLIIELKNKLISSQKETEFYKDLSRNSNHSSISRPNSRNIDKLMQFTQHSTNNENPPVFSIEEIIELRQAVSALEQENANLENTQLQLIENLNLCQEEIFDLKQQSSNNFYPDQFENNSCHSSSSTKESQQALLLETIREQLQEAYKRIEKQNCVIQQYSQRGYSLKRTEINSPIINSLYENLASLQQFCSQSENNQALICINQLKEQFYLFEVFLSDLVNNLRNSIFLEEVEERSKIVSAEIKNIENICLGNFSSALNVISLQEKIEALNKNLSCMEEKETSLKSPNCENDSIVSNIKDRDDLLDNIYSQLLIISSTPKVEYSNFEDFKDTILKLVSSLGSALDERLLEKINEARVEFRYKMNHFNQEFNEKSERLNDALEKVDNLSGRYLTLKEKALILKSRLGKAKACNEDYVNRIRELEGGSDTLRVVK